MARPTFQPPKGTRDFYPAELLVRRYITDAWRRVALRHGFDEIDGPTFETAALYKVKSGDAILGEMFGVFSGKDPEDVAAAGRGDPPFVLRPEFTPTLARMYAAKAAQLPKPTKWFCVPNFFRAERPQRGRLREFMQFNVDILGENAELHDVELFALVSDLFNELGFVRGDIQILFGNRSIMECLLIGLGIARERLNEWFVLLDKLEKISNEEYLTAAAALGIDRIVAARIKTTVNARFNLEDFSSGAFDSLFDLDRFGAQRSEVEQMLKDRFLPTLDSLVKLWKHAALAGAADWMACDLRIVRGLAYYTGTVFEVIAEGERAVAGGGRYDNLVELFGGPPTPACGFGMGDVVLGNLLADKGLMPEGKDLLGALSRPMPVRPDAFVIASNDEAAAHVTAAVAQLRRGIESPEYLAREARKPWDADRYTIPPLHARRSYKSTKNVGKLLADANACHARFAVILESPEKATLKNLESGNQDTLDTKDIGKAISGSH